MNLVSVMLVSLVAWLVYSMLQSYRNIAQELREIRIKCMNDSSMQVDPVDRITKTVVSGLETVKKYAAVPE